MISMALATDNHRSKRRRTSSRSGRKSSSFLSADSTFSPLLPRGIVSFPSTPSAPPCSRPIAELKSQGSHAGFRVFFDCLANGADDRFSVPLQSSEPLSDPETSGENQVRVAGR